jgi:hypothetical protein
MTEPRDNFRNYYTEKLWQLIPEVYRQYDTTSGTLRAIVEIIGSHASIARRGVDRLSEDAFIEYCDDWAVPYIADLVGTRLVNPLNVRGRRVDVASTMFYRRRNGTPRVLSMFPRDIAGWDGVIVESFRRLGRTPHRLDPPLAGANAQPSGRLTLTPPGGFANLRSLRGAEAVGGPFEEYSRTADFRQLRGEKGRFNIPKLNVHLYRLRTFEIDVATAYSIGPKLRTIDPSGRDVQLYARGPGDESDVTAERLFQAYGNQALAAAQLRTGLPDWRMPLPITCRMLAEMRYRLLPESFDPIGWAQAAGMFGLQFVDRDRLVRILLPLFGGNMTKVDAVIAKSVDPLSAKYNLLKDPARTDQPPPSLELAIGPTLQAASLDPATVLPADLSAWGSGIAAPAGSALMIDPKTGRVVMIKTGRLIDKMHITALFGPLGAGVYDRSETVEQNPTTIYGQTPAAVKNNPGPIAIPALPTSGICQWPDSRTYSLTTPAGGNIIDITDLTLQAANGARPLVRLERSDGGVEWVITAKAIANPATDARTLTIDGLWIGIRNAAAAPTALSAGQTEPTPVTAVLALDGVFNRVTLRNVTLDPGGFIAPANPAMGLAIPGIRLELRGEIEVLEIERSIVGPLLEVTSSTDPSSAGHIIVRDSVIQSRDGASKAIQTTLGKVTLDRCTVLGDVDVAWLDASETLVQGLVTVTNNQSGCFRFSAANGGSQTPAAFQSHFYAHGIPDRSFVSKSFGNAGYAALSQTADTALRRGAENGSEIGVWCSAIAPIRLADLATKTREYLPFALIPQFIVET